MMRFSEGFITLRSISLDVSSDEKTTAMVVIQHATERECHAVEHPLAVRVTAVGTNSWMGLTRTYDRANDSTSL